jgi:U3 small nucleolar RNA-associated protein 24
VWLSSTRIAKDPRFERLPCMHKGTYADDCIVNRVTEVQRYVYCFPNITAICPNSIAQVLYCGNV